jgi:hypothetical protein
MEQIIHEAGYRVNKRKTRMSYGYYRKSLLGMVFNQKANYSKQDYLWMRAMIHNCAVHGFDSQYKKANQFSTDAMITWLRGKINWINQINPDKGEKLLREFADG